MTHRTSDPVPTCYPADIVRHELKCWPEYFRAIVAGSKRFEVRQDDRGFAVGHVLTLREWNPQTQCHTGTCFDARVTYILREGFGLPPGVCVMSIEPYGIPAAHRPSEAVPECKAADDFICEWLDCPRHRPEPAGPDDSDRVDESIRTGVPLPPGVYRVTRTIQIDRPASTYDAIRVATYAVAEAVGKAFEDGERHERQRRERALPDVADDELRDYAAHLRETTVADQAELVRLHDEIVALRKVAEAVGPVLDLWNEGNLVPQDGAWAEANTAVHALCDAIGELPDDALPCAGTDNKTPDACPGGVDDASSEHVAGIMGGEHTSHASRGAGRDRQRDTRDGGERAMTEALRARGVDTAELLRLNTAADAARRAQSWRGFSATPPVGEGEGG